MPTILVVILAIAVVAWLVGLTIAWLVVLRQVGLLSLGAPINAQLPGASNMMAGMPIPAQLESLYSSQRHDESYLLWFSSTCMSCKDVARQFADDWQAGLLQ